MNIGERTLTTNPARFLAGQTGEFRVVDQNGKVERYVCRKGHSIESITLEGIELKNSSPKGSYWVERLSSEFVQSAEMSSPLGQSELT